MSLEAALLLPPPEGPKEKKVRTTRSAKRTNDILDASKKGKRGIARRRVKELNVARGLFLIGDPESKMKECGQLDVEK